MSQAIAVWATPDSQTVSGTIRVGVSAFIYGGISSVEFWVDAGAHTHRYYETKNPDHLDWEGRTLYEYVYTIDTTGLANGSRTVHAIANPNSGTAHTLPDLVIQVANGVSYDTWHVAASGNDTTGDGLAAETAWATLDHACSQAASGDTIQIDETGSYDFPDQDYSFTEYVTVTANTGVTATVGAGYSSSVYVYGDFLKFVGLTMSVMLRDPTSLPFHHIWFDGCTWTGRGCIYRDGDVNGLFMYASQGATHITVTNCEMTDANAGFQIVGGTTSRFIFIGNTLSHFAHDNCKVHGDEGLVRGCKFGWGATLNPWSIAKQAPTYVFGGGQTLSFYATDGSYPMSFSLICSVVLTGTQSAADVVSALNADGTFATYWVAVLSDNAMPVGKYPYSGRPLIRMHTKTGAGVFENHAWYCSGTAQATLQMSDNMYALNDIASGTPSYKGTDLSQTSAPHNDALEQTQGDASDWIFADLYFDGSCGQGIKIAAAAGLTRTRMAFINIAGNLSGSNEMLAGPIWYFQSGGAAGNAWVDCYIAHNTLWKSDDNARKSVEDILGTGNPTDYSAGNVIRNSIVGIYSHCDYVGTTGLDSDFNYFTTRITGSANSNSISANSEPGFIDGGTYPVDSYPYDLHLDSDAVVIGEGDADAEVHFDIEGNWRNATPDMGAYEYAAAAHPDAAGAQDTIILVRR